MGIYRVHGIRYMGIEYMGIEYGVYTCSYTRANLYLELDNGSQECTLLPGIGGRA